MQVIGLCRFSYPALGGFQVEHGDAEARAEYLYSDARMANRFRQFETLCLPSIRQQTDNDFLFLVLVGDAMPAPWRDRLDALLASVPQARIVTRPPGPHRRVCQEVINSHRDMDQPCLEFRHDDDDAVALTFVRDLKEAAVDCAGLRERHRLVGLDWAKGYVVQADAKGLWAAETLHPFWGVAQAVAVQPRTTLSIMNFAHAKLPRFMPTVSFSETPAYLRGHNAFNDSRQRKDGKTPDLVQLTPAQEAAFKTRFGVDADHVRAVFAG